MHVAQGHRATVHWALRQEQTFARKTFNAGTPTEEKGLWGDDVVYVCVRKRVYIHYALLQVHAHDTGNRDGRKL